MNARGFKERMGAGGILLCDGALGSEFISRGLEVGSPPEQWNLTRPDEVAGLAREYLDAGAEILQSNSFGGSPTRLAQFGLEDRCEVINRRAVEIVRAIAGVKALVAGTVGPSGLGPRERESLGPGLLKAGFERQISALAEAGADLLIVETMTGLDEAMIALAAAKHVAPHLPLIATLTFMKSARGFSLADGTELQICAMVLADAGADAIGSNCGTGLAQMLEIARAFQGLTELPLVFQPSAGLPELTAGKAVYPDKPELFSEWIPELLAAKTRMLGGCCGCGPAHIRAIRNAIDAFEP